MRFINLMFPIALNTYSVNTWGKMNDQMSEWVNEFQRRTLKISNQTLSRSVVSKLTCISKSPGNLFKNVIPEPIWFRVKKSVI